MTTKVDLDELTIEVLGRVDHKYRSAVILCVTIVVAHKEGLIDTSIAPILTTAIANLVGADQHDTIEDCYQLIKAYDERYR